MLSVITGSQIVRHCHAAPSVDEPACVADRKQLEHLREGNGRTHWPTPTEEEQYSRSPYSLSSLIAAVLSQKETGFIRVETLVSTLMPLAVGTAPLPGRQDSLAL